MSRTDKHRPYWVRLADTPTYTCITHHDHRFGPCTLPDEVTAHSVERTHDGCHWFPAPGCTACAWTTAVRS